jgi:hypothetical protein
MRRFKINWGIGVFIALLSCIENNTGAGDVSFYSSFEGARLDSTKHIKGNRYVCFINPAFEPVNPSAYFAFGVSSKSEKEIEIELNYGKHKHRYIPKLSLDKRHWKNIEKSRIKVDTLLGNATINLLVSQDTLYVAAQEIETSADTYKWLDTMLAEHTFLKRELAGKTVKDNNNYVVTTNKNLKKGIVLIARQHPPEIPGGTIGFKSFYETLLNHSETAVKFREQYNVITFPLLNLDGVDMGNWRHNANGVDLNRDWVSFSQPETQMVKRYMEELQRSEINIVFALDFHTSYSGPYLLVLDSLSQKKTKNIIPDWIHSIEANSQFKVEARPRSQELPYCYNYFINQFGCEAVTYEEGDEIDRDIIRDRAKVYANELMKTLLIKND